MDAERFLTNIISTLSTSPDFRTSVDNLARLATEGLADWCGVYMFENDQTIRRLAVAPATEIEALFPLDLHELAGPAQVRRTGEHQILSNPGPDIAAGLGVSPEALLLPNGARPSMYACLPAGARNRTIGAVVFMS